MLHQPGVRMLHSWGLPAGLQGAASSPREEMQAEAGPPSLAGKDLAEARGYFGQGERVILHRAGTPHPASSSSEEQHLGVAEVRQAHSSVSQDFS